MTPHGMRPELRCAACGWVHVQISEAEALASGALLESYLRCFQCAADSATFVPACAGDAPDGCTLQAVVVRGQGVGD